MLLLAGGYLAETRVPDTATEPPDALEYTWRQRLATEPVYALRAAAVVAALGVTLLGAAPMAVAAG
jgi:carbamoylphosphate synthase large subunit